MWWWGSPLGRAKACRVLRRAHMALGPLSSRALPVGGTVARASECRGHALRRTEDAGGTIAAWRIQPLVRGRTAQAMMA